MNNSDANSPPTAADIIQLVDKDLDLFEAINDGEEEHLEGSESLPPITPLTKAWDIAYVRFSVPDLELYQNQVHDFGFKIMIIPKYSLAAQIGCVETWTEESKQ